MSVDYSGLRPIDVATAGQRELYQYVMNIEHATSAKDPLTGRMTADAGDAEHAMYGLIEQLIRLRPVDLLGLVQSIIIRKSLDGTLDGLPGDDFSFVSFLIGSLDNWCDKKNKIRQMAGPNPFEDGGDISDEENDQLEAVGKMECRDFRYVRGGPKGGCVLPGPRVRPTRCSKGKRLVTNSRSKNKGKCTGWSEWKINQRTGW